MEEGLKIGWDRRRRRVCLFHRTGLVLGTGTDWARREAWVGVRYDSLFPSRRRRLLVTYAYGVVVVAPFTSQCQLISTTSPRGHEAPGAQSGR